MTAAPATCERMESPLTAPRPDQESAPAPALWIARLQLTAFRNYRFAELETGGEPLVLTGPNGAGKTNLLEAVSFLAPGRGLRRAALGDVERFAGGENAPAAWAVAAQVMTPEGRRDLGTGRDPSAQGRERRTVKIDGGVAGSQQALGEIVAVTWLTPQMDRLFQDSPGGRRRFVDRLVYGVDPAHAGRVTNYDNAMRERARLLRDRASPDPAWLGVLEQRMAEQGVAIAAARRLMVDRLARAAVGGPNDSAFPRASLGLSGALESWLQELSALEAEERLTQELAAARTRDAETGGASYGPHRSDLVAHHLEKDLPAEICSTGEQKALLISIVLAHARLLTAERGFAPLVLLDEVAAHLDAERRAALFDELLGLGAQPWLTGTEPDLFHGLNGRARFLEVDEGRIEPAGR